jgi:hypothetical protein
MKIIGILLLIIVGAIVILAGLFLYPIVKLFNTKSKPESQKNGYVKLAENRVVWRNTLLGFISYSEYPISEADYASFQKINTDFAKDKKYAYYQQLYFTVDLPSFEAINGYYSKDKNAVYFKNKKIPGAKPLFIKEIEPHILSDGERVYYQKQLISNHSQGFVQLSRYPNVYKSTDNVFFEYSILENADAPTFEVIDSTLSRAYFRDKSSVYYYNMKIKHADAATFEPLNDHYAKDKNHVFYQDSLLKNADYPSFRVIDKEKAEDKFRQYAF